MRVTSEIWGSGRTEALVGRQAARHYAEVGVEDARVLWGESHLDRHALAGATVPWRHKT